MRLLDETVEHLRRLIELDTTNPPGNELPAAQYIDGVLRAEGVETTLIEPVPGRAVVAGRIRGRGGKRPILLTAHMDVVGVEPAGWTHPPFGGDVHAGYVYGRGAIDDKGMLAVLLTATLEAKRRKIVGDRDLVLLATSDEESGGRYGMEWIIQHHPELVDAEFALNEGGRIRIIDGRPAYAAIQTSEKVANVVKLIARGPGGHAAVPIPGNPVVHLARALSRIADHPQPVNLSATTREFFHRLAGVLPDIESTPNLDALRRTTISATVIAGGIRHNVIPTEAEATLSIRTLPGDPLDDVVRRLLPVIDDPAVEIQVVSAGREAAASDHRSPMFAALEGALHDLDPRILVAPYLSAGATENSHLRRHGIQCYGLLPFPLTPDDESRMHGHDERVPLEGLDFAVRLVIGMLERLR